LLFVALGFDHAQAITTSAIYPLPTEEVSIMPHLLPLGTHEAQPQARATLESLQRKLGNVPNMYRTFAHAPKVLDAAVAMAQAIRSDLDPKFRELAYLKVTQVTRCHV
jgi:alkylhydroperoxidase family enzyme